ncbi:MAG: 50S ribosomal protein L18 [Saprospirales bacterium]|nr:MAG: 50S ribosomal protein L18 [Saprospirales bacterium]
MKLTRRKRIKYRVRSKVKGTPDRPRLTVYRSNKNIHCQVIDDVNGTTLVHASSVEEGIPTDLPKGDTAKKVGEVIAQRAKDANIEKVVFDRAGYRYHGRVKALADGAREGGLIF